MINLSLLLFLLLLFVVLGFEHKALHLQSRCPATNHRAYTLSYFTNSFFVMGFFEIKSRQLFAQAGLEPKSS
jgi:hypothetical protein